MKALKIAIVGAGFAGLACAVLLKDRAEITLFDEKGLGGGASGVAAGLMHPFTGVRAKCAYRGAEGMEATKELIALAEDALKEPVAIREGVLRVATNQKSAAFYEASAEKHPHLQIWDEKMCLQKAFAKGLLGLYIPEGMAVDGPKYLKGLLKASGATLVKKKIGKEELDDLCSSFDHVILTTGAATGSLVQEPCHPVKGQLLRLAWPDGMPPLPLPLSAGAYAIMTQDQKSVWVGSTFEHTFDNEEPDLALASAQILPKVYAFLPQLQGSAILDIKAGVRLSTPDHLPFVKRLNTKLSVMAGFGSKGLLHHALLAQTLAEHLGSNFS